MKCMMLTWRLESGHFWFWDFIIKNLQDFIKIYRALIKEIFLMGSPTVIHLQCSLVNKILVLIPCGSCVFPQTPVLTGF